MRRGIWFKATSLAMAVSLTTACGGDGNSSSAGTPLPAPTPAPSPTPTPTPAFVAQAATALGGPCFVYLYSTRERAFDAQSSGRYCSRNGTFGPATDLIQFAGFGPAQTNFATMHNMVVAIDNSSSTAHKLIAPQGSVVYSPLTSLIELTGDQARVKSALGLNSGNFSLGTDPDLRTFNTVTGFASTDPAIRDEAARVTANNLRAIAVAVGSTSMGISDFSYDPYRIDAPEYEGVAQHIVANGQFMFNNVTMSQLLNRFISSNPNLKPEVISAGAHLIDAYAAAIALRVTDQSTVAQYALGAYGYLRIELVQLFSANTIAAASTAQTVTAPQIIAATEIFRETVPFPTTGLFFPAPNFFYTTSNSLTIRADRSGDPGFRGSLVDNDLYANGPAASGGLGFFGAVDSVVQSITIPATRAGQISASLSGGTITVNALGGFKGRTYFDYTARHPSGETGTARVYVNFR